MVPLQSESRSQSPSHSPIALPLPAIPKLIKSRLVGSREVVRSRGRKAASEVVMMVETGGTDAFRWRLMVGGSQVAVGGWRLADDGWQVAGSW